jgi:hypothetical protein
MATLDLSKRDRAIILDALALAVEHQHRAIAHCCDQLRGGFVGVNDAIVERRRTLNEFERLRQRLIGADSGR